MNDDPYRAPATSETSHRRPWRLPALLRIIICIVAIILLLEIVTRMIFNPIE